MMLEPLEGESKTIGSVLSHKLLHGLVKDGSQAYEDDETSVDRP